MSTEALFFFFRIPLKQLLNYLHKKVSNIHASQFKFQKSPSFVLRSGLTDCDTLVFNVEGTLLKSSSLFPYFMLVAFEAGSLLRALLLFLLYPFTCLVREEMGIKMMVIICFFGIKKASFRAGSAVLPKFFLEDVGIEGFEMMRRGRKKVAVSCLPRVMVESFLRDYLEVDIVVGRELKVVGGYFVGLMEEKKKDMSGLEAIFGDDQKRSCRTAIGINNLNRPIAHHFFSHCKDVYLMSEADRTSWHHLPRDKYTKPLIFHDGRLALRPTPLSTLAMFMWVPFGSCLAIFRIIVALSLPNKISLPILVFSGLRLKLTAKPKGSPSVLTAKQNKPKGLLYVCNHRTLLDPLYISFALSKPVTAVTYSLSRLSELLAPIRTVRLTRDRDQDGKMMDKLLSQGDLVVCPEGTTCREPYLLRFSPLFSEMSDNIIPVAMDSHVSMFHGTTAGGLKCLDPLFFLMNPCPSYNIQFLEKVSGASCHDGGESRFHVANHVQSELGKALGFECTSLNRKDKYLTLAGNEGIV
ncbi:putative glycerol-3-phosphate acyltransferase 3 [Vitis vinifera]|uniref:Putative glycerol-3-phosphate acyltransferase 3 n=1 Tax=Vitis vinifera TaxID=29760 RepID=A0A438IXQ6_VITVI|nr:putative glycerol-3-phosphate acyltransferase 3 [Vitis vinifera]